MGHSILINKSEEWRNLMQTKHVELFIIPTAILTSITLVTDPILLACILCFRGLRQETRYLLLANTLISDIIFLCLNLTSIFCNALGVAMVSVLCEVIMVITVTTYCCSVLTVTVMGVDTYLAVRWPLHYNDLLPPARARKLILGLWALAALYPLSLLVVMEVLMEGGPHTLPLCLTLISLGSLGQQIKVGIHVYFTIGVILCTIVIVYCYVRLYVVTKTSGIWQNRYSRARVTLLAHGVMLVLYFTPGMVFVMELALFEKDAIRQNVCLWLNVVNMSVLMLLPRACAPYLYGLRYREIHDNLQLLLWKRRHLTQVTVAQTEGGTEEGLC